MAAIAVILKNLVVATGYVSSGGARISPTKGLDLPTGGVDERSESKRRRVRGYSPGKVF